MFCVQGRVPGDHILCPMTFMPKLSGAEEEGQSHWSLRQRMPRNREVETRKGQMALQGSVPPFIFAQ